MMNILVLALINANSACLLLSCSSLRKKSMRGNKLNLNLTGKGDSLKRMYAIGSFFISLSFVLLSLFSYYGFVFEFIGKILFSQVSTLFRVISQVMFPSQSAFFNTDLSAFCLGLLCGTITVGGIAIGVHEIIVFLKRKKNSVNNFKKKEVNLGYKSINNTSPLYIKDYPLLN